MGIAKNNRLLEKAVGLMFEAQVMCVVNGEKQCLFDDIDHGAGTHIAVSLQNSGGDSACFKTFPFVQSQGWCRFKRKHTTGI